jgi:threonine aldolase
MQMASKMRFLSCQFIPYLGEGLWRKNALHANSMAQLLRQRLSSIPGSHFPYATEANEVFVALPEPWHAKLKGRAHAYQWDKGLLRLVCSYDTQKEDIDSLVDDLA